MNRQLNKTLLIIILLMIIWLTSIIISPAILINFQLSFFNHSNPIQPKSNLTQAQRTIHHSLFMPSNSKFERKPKTSVFHIRIGNNIDKIDLKDPAFLKLLEQQYATKYLQSLGVESTAKNIYKILKQYPIENCQILESRLNGGLYTDTITIIPKTASEINDNLNNQKQLVSNEMIQMLDLKRMGDKKYNSQKVNTNSTQNNPAKDNDPLEDSIIGAPSLQHQTNSKKGNTNGSNFRVKGNNARTQSNAFLMQKSGSITGDKSSANLLTNYEDMGFAKIKVSKPQADTEPASEGLKFLSFNIQDIKSRYIFPFNDNFKRKSNYKLEDNSNLIQPEDPRIVYEWNVFHFPFTQVKLSLNTLKELQNPIDAKMNHIGTFLDSFYQEFPTHVFPIAPDLPKHFNSLLIQNNLNSTLINPHLNITSSIKNSQIPSSSIKSKTINKTSQSFGQQTPPTTMLFTKLQIDTMFSMLRSQSMVKFIGVFLHLAYWCIFGGVNPIQIQSSMKKKMYIMMFQTIEYFKIKVDNKKLWALLVFPMVLLTLKMAAHYFFSLQYIKIFQAEQTKKLGIDQLALDKIMYLVEKMFDQSNINGRFIFLESQITGAKGTFLKDKEFIRSRIFGTSPGLQIILPNPKNGKARAIMAKNSSAQKLSHMQNYGKISQIRSTVGGTSIQGKQCQQKLLSLALHKINNRLEQIQGHSSQTNPIINLKV